jgi:hypothetical protein
MCKHHWVTFYCRQREGPYGSNGGNKASVFREPTSRKRHCVHDITLIENGAENRTFVSSLSGDSHGRFAILEYHLRTI